MIRCGTPTGHIVADGVPLHSLAWTLPHLVPLWLGGNVRGEDRLIPGLNGVVPYQRRTTVTTLGLRMIICGDVDPAGEPYANPWVGLLENIDYLRTNVIDPTGTGDGTRPWVLHLPGGGTRAAAVHALSLQEGATMQGTTADGADGVIMRASLEISIPKGVFV